VIGVLPDGLGTGPAHAWVDGTDPHSAATYLELHRLLPPTGRRPAPGVRQVDAGEGGS